MAPRVQVNINPGNHGLCPFLNWAKHKPGLPWLKIGGTDQTGSAISARFDSNYELIDTSTATQFGFYFYLTPSSLVTLPSFASKAMVVKWSGGAAVTGLTGLSVTGLSVNLGAKRATFNLQSSAQSNTCLFWALDGSNGGPTNIVICEASKESLVDAGRIMDPDWLAFYSKYAILRLLDCMSTNGSEAVDYADLPATSFAYWGGAAKTDGFKVGWPVAAHVDIANRTHRPIHVQIPHQWTDAAITSYATALRDGITWTASEVLVYVGFSNEVWNSAFAQNAYSMTQGGAAGWTTGSGGQKSWQWTGYRAAQVMEIFRTVFGTDSGAKWAGVAETQAANTAVTTGMKTGIDRHLSADSPVNSSLVKLFSYLAGAYYFAPVPTSDSSGVGLTMNQWLAVSQANFNQNYYDALKFSGTSDSTFANLDWCKANWLAQKTLADSYGIGMLEYEGGFHGVTSTGIQNTSPLVAAHTAFSLTSLCAQLTYDRLVQFVADTGGIASQFVAVGPSNKNGNWGSYGTYVDYTNERGNAVDAFNLGLTYRPGYRNVRTI
jgi:hypothetical protein